MTDADHKTPGFCFQHHRFQKPTMLADDSRTAIFIPTLLSLFVVPVQSVAIPALRIQQGPAASSSYVRWQVGRSDAAGNLYGLGIRVGSGPRNPPVVCSFSQTLQTWHKILAVRCLRYITFIMDSPCRHSRYQQLRSRAYPFTPQKL